MNKNNTTRESTASDDVNLHAFWGESLRRITRRSHDFEASG
jgi:hypothetical protein